MKSRTLPEAEEELLAAGVWYNRQRPGLGLEFVESFEDAVAQIEANPHSFSRLDTVRTKRHIRRFLMKRFPYYVAYEILQSEVVILAIAHGRRRPNYFIRRKS